jgi:Ca2+-binding EF-hand superfamily protein
MKRIMLFAGALLFILSVRGAGQTKGDKDPPKKLPPLVQEVLSLTPEEFIKRFDKNNDGLLSKDELPPFAAKGFEKFDSNGDGYLNKEEVAAMLPVLRKLMSGSGGPALGNTPDEIVENLLKLMDTNKDGKISREEAKGKIAEDFDKIDQNKDGYLDRKELTSLAQRMLANAKFGPKGGPFGGGPDFDALDKNADGRLTPDELKGTPWAARFAEIDTDGNGYIDRREFERFLRKEREKKE